MGKSGCMGAVIVVAACIFILSAVVFCETQLITSPFAGLESYCFRGNCDGAHILSKRTR